MISKSKINQITSLQKKKFRDELKLFIVEGTKSVMELIASDFTIDSIIATQSWFDEHSVICNAEKIVATDDEIKKISNLNTPQGVVAIAHQKDNRNNNFDFSKGLHIILDTVQDPGNVGTIIRMSDWFGINSIICSDGCADVYNYKVIQATMGSIFRVPVFYKNLDSFFSEIASFKPTIIGTFMNGDNIYTAQLPRNGFIIMGNEGNGISDMVSKHVTQRITIPSFNTNNQHPESLNVAIATSIVCSELKRRFI